MPGWSGKVAGGKSASFSLFTTAESNGTTPGAVILKRTDTEVTIIIKDQSQSPVRDTLYFNLSCTGSKDGIVQMMAIETGPNTGIYESVPVPKAEGGAVDDKILQCLSRDFVKVNYTDVVYDSIKNVEKEINEPVKPTLSFASTV